jgi:ribosomal protein S18 acetylase RimI-like enzyme
VARAGEEIIGMGAAERGEVYNRLGALYVLPRYQGQGIGRRLLEEALSWLGNAKPVSLGVAQYNAGAIEFYRRHGFEIKGPMENFQLASGKTIPLLEMVKDAERQ